MGFTTGFFSGIVLTSSFLYLSIYNHQRSRQQQALFLRQQSILLNSITDPTTLPHEPDAPRFVPGRPSWSETFKDRWNEEIAGVVIRIERLRWADVWDQVQGAAHRAGLGEKAREVRETVVERTAVGDRVQDAKTGLQTMVHGAKDAKDNVRERVLPEGWAEATDAVGKTEARGGSGPPEGRGWFNPRGGKAPAGRGGSES